jgi:hypothetical protein
VKFRKKPIVIEAQQFIAADKWPEGVVADARSSTGFAIDTLEGRALAVADGDWIITGVQGERYPCKPDIFAATYEPAETIPTPSAHSGEQGKPSDASIGKAFVEVVGNWSHRRAKETFSKVMRRASEIECRDLRDQEQRVLRAQDQFRKAQDNLDATARELERKHEQSEPVMHGTSQAAFDQWMSESSSDQAGNAHSEGCAISDEVKAGAMKAFWAAHHTPQVIGMRVGRTYAGVCAVLEWYESAFPRGVEGTDIDAYVMDSGTVSVDVVLTSTKRVFSVMAMKDGSVGYAAYIDGDRYHGKIDAEAFGVALRKPLHEDAHPAPEAQAEGERRCDDCGGSGEQFGSYACDTCGGSGLIRPQPSASETPSEAVAEAGAKLYNAMTMQEQRESGAFHIPQPSARRIWDEAKAAWEAAIAAQRKEGE